MKQSYVKTAEEAIKKAEAVQYRFLTQEEFGSGQVPDSVREAGHWRSSSIVCTV